MALRLVTLALAVVQGAAELKSVLEPLRMSDVALEGEYKQAEIRNQEVLLSLNPRRELCGYSPEGVARHRRLAGLGLPPAPHVYAVAQAAVDGPAEMGSSGIKLVLYSAETGHAHDNGFRIKVISLKRTRIQHGKIAIGSGIVKI